MITVHRHLLGDQHNEIETHQSAKVVLVDARGSDELYVWLEVNTFWPEVTKTLWVFATGEPIPKGLSHVGSVQVAQPDGILVVHVYEEDRPR